MVLMLAHAMITEDWLKLIMLAFHPHSGWGKPYSAYSSTVGSKTARDIFGALA